VKFAYDFTSFWVLLVAVLSAALLVGFTVMLILAAVRRPRARDEA
jgi:hypothetical protein